MKPEPPRPMLIRAEAAYRDALADPRAGRRRAESVAGDARTAGDDEALAVALRAAGWAARELYDHDAASLHLDEAVRVASRSGFRDRLCEALITRSTVHLELGHDGHARRDLLAARRAAGERTLAEVAFAEALLEDAVGDYRAAVDAYRRALALMNDDRPDLRVKALNNLALTVLRLGRYQEAERRLNDAAAVAATYSPMATAIVAQSQAFVAVESGQPVEALRRFERAEGLLAAADLPLVELHLDKAAAFLSLRLLDEAAAAADRAVLEYEEHAGGSFMLGEALVLRARIALAQDDSERAITASSRAETLLRGQHRRGWRADAVLLSLKARVKNQGLTTDMITELDRIERTMARLGNVPSAVEAGVLQGQVCAALGRTRKAANAFDRAATNATRGPVLLRLLGRTAAARKAELHGDRRRVGRLCRSGLDELARYRSTFASPELRAKVAAYGKTLAELGLRSALQSGRVEGIWAWIERDRGTIFLRTEPSGSPSEPPPLLPELRALEKNLAALAPDHVVERATLSQRITRLEHRLRSHAWTSSGASMTWAAPSMTTLRSLRADIGGRVLLQYGLLDGRLIAVAVTSRRLRFAEIGPVRPVIDSGQQLAFALRRLSQLRARRSVDAAFTAARSELQTLAKALVLPFAEVVADADEVIVASPAALISIPWGVLDPLAERPVRVVPSAMSWWRTSGRVPKSDRVVLVEGPDLAGARDEVAAIASRYRLAEQLTGDAAACDAVREAATDARIVHFACHGRLRADSPSFSALLLADGPLTVHDLERLAQPAHHWVLAACDLGSPGRLTGGEELEGVLAALLFGGVGGIVAAIVSVPDLPTADFMVRLHQALSGGASLSEALQSARGHMDASDPAGFVTSVGFSCYGGG